MQPQKAKAKNYKWMFGQFECCIYSLFLYQHEDKLDFHTCTVSTLIAVRCASVRLFDLHADGSLKWMRTSPLLHALAQINISEGL